MNRIVKIIALVLLLAMLASSLFVALAASEVKELPRADDVAGERTGVADYTLTTLDGKELRLSSLRGKPVLLDFFSATCQHCQAHAPFIVEMARKYPTLTVINLASNNQFVDGEKVEEYRRAANIKNTIAYAPYALFAAYLQPNEQGIVGVPQAVLFDAQGKITAHFTKWTDADKPAIEAAIAKQIK